MKYIPEIEFSRVEPKTEKKTTWKSIFCDAHESSTLAEYQKKKKQYCIYTFSPNRASGSINELIE